MSNIFCPRCGKETEDLYNDVCRDCLVRNKKIIECPRVVHLKTCPACGFFFRKGKWTSKDDETGIVTESVKDVLKINKSLQEVDVVISPGKLDTLMYIVQVEARASVEGIEIKETNDVEVRIGRESCDVCNRIAGGYFEGIVQVRADNRIPTQEELEKCQSIAEEVSARARNKGDRLAFISRTVELDEGVDIYVGLSKLGRQVCKAIIDIFGGSVTESPKLAGRKDGVDLYRITFALRLPEFVRGDILEAGEKIIEVHKYGKIVSGIELETGKRFVENKDKLKKVKKLSRREDAVSAVLVSDEGNTVQVLDPETYESVTLKKPEFLDVEPGNEIKVVKTKNGIYVLSES